jgi:hypothetical protein
VQGRRQRAEGRRKKDFSRKGSYQGGFGIRSVHSPASYSGFQLHRAHLEGHDNIHRCQLNVSWAVKTAAIQTKPACAGFKTVDFSLVRVGGLGFYSSEFHSPGLKLTPMDNIVPLRSFALLYFIQVS